MKKNKLLVIGSGLVLALASTAKAEGLSDVTTAISGMGTVMLAGVSAIVTAGIALKVIPMGIRFLGKVWRAITS